MYREDYADLFKIYLVLTAAGVTACLIGIPLGVYLAFAFVL
jgi:hypothetical protein